MFKTGAWKNYEELEDSISLPELTATYETLRKEESRMQRLIAAAMGADVSKWQDDEEPLDISRTKDSEEEIRQSVFERAKNRIKEKVDQSASFQNLGIGYESRGG